MKKYGIEVEFFVKERDTGKVVVIPTIEGLSGIIQTDELPILGEIRTNPYPEIHLVISDALALLRTVAKRLAKFSGGKYMMDISPKAELTKEIWSELRTIDYHKGGVKERNVYGLERKMNLKGFTAGLHIHFSEDDTFKYTDSDRKNKEFTYPRQLDMPFIIRQLDDRFGKEVKAAGRQIGWYELKAHGFEYRSLPNNISLEGLLNFIEDDFRW